MFIEYIEEAYFGKTQEVLDIEKSVSQLRKKYTVKDNPKDIVNDKIATEIEQKIEKTFGFKKVYFGIEQEVYYNCYTIPVRQSKYGDLTDKYDVTDKGIRYKDEVEAETLIVCTNTLFFDEKLTDGEVMSTILHEIGHSFTEAVVPIEIFFDTFRESLHTHIKYMMAMITEKTKVLPSISNLIKTISDMIIDTPFSFLNTIIDKSPIMKNLITGIGRMSNRRRYIDEKFSDQFAAMHGYGKELSSILAKIDYNPKIKDPKGEIGKLYHLSCGLIDTSMEALFGNTPMLSARMKSAVRVLEHELENNKTLPPKLKADMKQQIKEIDLLAIQYSKIDTSPKYVVAKKMYFKFMYDNMKEGDFVSKLLVSTYNLDKVDTAFENNKK